MHGLCYLLVYRYRAERFTSCSYEMKAFREILHYLLEPVFTGLNVFEACFVHQITEGHVPWFITGTICPSTPNRQDVLRECRMLVVVGFVFFRNGKGPFSSRDRGRAARSGKTFRGAVASSLSSSASSGRDFSFGRGDGPFSWLNR